MSRLLNKVYENLSAAPQSRDWFRNRSRLAIYFAHKGDDSAAAHEVLRIREALQYQGSAHGVVYVNLAEATICYQAGSTSEAIEKSRRAYALSKAMPDKALISLSSAWLAHFYFSAGKYEDAIISANESLVDGGFGDEIAVTRATLAIADMYHFFGDFESARKWYDTARSAAVKEGDEVMIGIILYNTATYRLNNVRMSEFTAGLDADNIFRLSLEVASSSNYDFGVRSSAFPLLLPLLNAQAFTLIGKFAEAAAIFNGWLSEHGRGDMKGLYPALRADYAWCLANLGRRGESLGEVSRAIDDLEFCNYPDDRAMTLYRITTILRYFGLSEQALVWEMQMQAALSEHRRIQAKVLVALNSTFKVNEQK